MQRLNRTLAIQFGGLAVVMIALLVLSRTFPVTEWLESLQQRIVGMGVWGVIGYPLLYALCNLLLLPGGFLSIGGGFFFGLWWGFLLVLTGNLGGAAVAFLISRKLGRERLMQRLERNPRLSALDQAIAREGGKIVLLSQLHPLFPTSLLNYLYGLTNISFGACMRWVAVGQAPGLFLYVYIGTLGQFGLRVAEGKTHPHLSEYWLWGTGLLFSAVILVILGRIAVRLSKEAESRAALAKAVDAPSRELASVEF